MSFRPKGEIPETVLLAVRLLKSLELDGEFYPTDPLL